MDDQFEEQEQSISPTPQKTEDAQVLHTFPQAVQLVIDGKRITRLDWHDDNTYGLLKDGFLMIYVNNEFHRWSVSDGDMLASDWVTLPEGN